MKQKEKKKISVSENELKKVAGGNGAPEAGDIIACPSCGFEDEAWSWYSGCGECPNCGYQVIE